MAVQRETEKCPKCGESYKAITRKNNPHNPFVGDDFICWDYDGHKCPEKFDGEAMQKAFTMMDISNQMFGGKNDNL